MRGDTAQGMVEFAMEECCNCGMPFYMTKDLEKRLRDAPGSTFWCPKGHAQHYTGKSEAQKLKDQLAAAKKEITFYSGRLNEESEIRVHTERRLAATKGHLTRAKNRLIEGNCPCCDAHFADLETHIKVTHPDFELEPADNEDPPKRQRGRPRKDGSVITKPQESTRAERKAATRDALEKN